MGDDPELEDLRQRIVALEEALPLMASDLLRCVFVAANRAELSDRQRADLLREIRAVMEETMPGIARRLRAANLPSMMGFDGGPATGAPDRSNN